MSRLVGVDGALGQDGVLRVLFQGEAVAAYRQALGGDALVPYRGVEEGDLPLLRQGGAGEAPAGGLVGHVWGHGDGLVLPVDQVLTGGVAPGEGGRPHDSAGVVLVVGVVLAAEIAQAVGVVHPALGGLDVELLAGLAHRCRSFAKNKGQEKVPDPMILRNGKNYKERMWSPRASASARSWVTRMTVLPWVRSRQ